MPLPWTRSISSYSHSKLITAEAELTSRTSQILSEVNVISNPFELPCLLLSNFKVGDVIS